MMEPEDKNYWVVETGSIEAPDYLTIPEAKLSVEWLGERENALQFRRKRDADAFVARFVVGLMPVDEYRITEYEG